MIRERERAAMSGVVIVFVLFAVLLASIYGFVMGIRAQHAPLIILSVAVFVTAVLLMLGMFRSIRTKPASSSCSATTPAR